MKKPLVGIAVAVAVVGMCIYFVKHIPTENQTIEDTPLPIAIETASDFEKGQYYFNHGEYADGTYDLLKAEEYFGKAIAENPRVHELLWYQSGRIDFLNGNFDSALLKFQKQIEYFGDTIPNVHYMIGLTYGYKARQTINPDDWQKAEESFKKAITFFDDAPWPYVDLAWVYFSQGKFVEMKPLLEKAFLVESNNPWLLNMYGLALLNTGEREMAHEYFLFAQEQAELLTVEDWGNSYPGNNPALWEEGLREFKALIAKNVALAKPE